MLTVDKFINQLIQSGVRCVMEKSNDVWSIDQDGLAEFFNLPVEDIDWGGSHFHLKQGTKMVEINESYLGFLEGRKTLKDT